MITIWYNTKIKRNFTAQTLTKKTKNSQQFIRKLWSYHSSGLFSVTYNNMGTLNSLLTRHKQLEIEVTIKIVIQHIFYRTTEMWSRKRHLESSRNHLIWLVLSAAKEFERKICLLMYLLCRNWKCGLSLRFFFYFQTNLSDAAPSGPLQRLMF